MKNRLCTFPVYDPEVPGIKALVSLAWPFIPVLGTSKSDKLSSVTTEPFMRGSLGEVSRFSVLYLSSSAFKSDMSTAKSCTVRPVHLL